MTPDDLPDSIGLWFRLTWVTLDCRVHSDVYCLCHEPIYTRPCKIVNRHMEMILRFNKGKGTQPVEFVYGNLVGMERVRVEA